MTGVWFSTGFAEFYGLENCLLHEFRKPQYNKACTFLRPIPVAFVEKFKKG